MYDTYLCKDYMFVYDRARVEYTLLILGWDKWVEKFTGRLTVRKSRETQSMSHYKNIRVEYRRSTLHPLLANSRNATSLKREQ